MTNEDNAPIRVEPPIRLGLIGTGLAIEKLHWPALHQLPERYVVTAFSDHSPAQARHFASYSGADLADYSADYHDLLARDDVDAVLICLPIPLLYPAARASLAAGKHVLCEKPTGTDDEQAQAFEKLTASYPDHQLLVTENYFYRDDLRLARSLLDTGAIGQLQVMSWRVATQLVPREGAFTSTPWRQRPDYRGGVHLDAGVHNIAQIRLLCGEARRVHGLAQEANSTISSWSNLTLNLEFADGAIGNYTATYPEIALPPEPNDMRLYGSDGVLIIDGTVTERQVRLFRGDEESTTHRFHGIDGGYYAELQDFSDALTYGEPAVGTVSQSAANMRLLLRGLDSAEQGSALVAGSAGDVPAVPLWRPRGGSGLFDGLPGEHTISTP